MSLGMLCGALCVSWGSWGALGAVVLSAGFGGLSRWCGCGCRGACLWGSVVIAGFLWMSWEGRLPWGESLERSLPSSRSAGRCVVVLTKTPPASGALSPWDTGGGVVLGEVLSWESSLGGGRLAFSGGRCVSLRANSWESQELLRQLPEGTLLEGEGVLSPLKNDDPLEARYAESLSARGAEAQLLLFAWRVAGESAGLRFRGKRLLGACRQFLGGILVEGTQETWEGQYLLALGLGMGECLPREIRQAQAVAGTVHAFAISGMHVGMMILATGFLLRWIGGPLLLRRIAMVSLATAYVLLTGAADSAQRALVMTAAYHYAALRTRPAVWLNLLGVAAVQAFLRNPLCLRNRGVLYSYSIVAILLLGSPLLRELQEILQEREQWLPRPLRHRRACAFWGWCLNGVGVSCLAWATSLSISLESSPRLGLLSPLVNLPLGFLVSLALLLCPLKILLVLLIPQGTTLWNATLRTVIRATAALSVTGSEASGPLCQNVAAAPPLPRLLFLLALILLLLKAQATLRSRRPAAVNRGDVVG